MEGTAVVPSGSPYSGALIVSRDPPLTEQLRGALTDDARCVMKVVASYREAERVLAEWRPETVFLDLRHASIEDPIPLLQQIGRRGARRIPVIAISDAGYVCDWAAVADLVVSGYLELPVNRQQLARLMADHGNRGAGPVWTASLTPRVVKGTSVTYKTYTPEMFALLDELVTVANHDVTVLLVGETGTGKTTLARLIHELSGRHEARLLTVACGALPPDLIESELFGHIKGAFTGADQVRQGKFEAAKNGTLLLDEIDVLGPGQQTKLLRVIETGEFEPVGSNETHYAKARLLVASNVDLKRLMETNAFRADLYYRLSMLELRIPPLRERPRDIVPLTLDFVEEFCTAHNIRIRQVHPDFLACLKRYPWPGNVRELKNHVRRAVLFCRSGVLTPDELAPQFQRNWEEPAPHPREGRPCVVAVPREPGTLEERMASNERQILEHALRENNYNRTLTARALGLSRVGLYKKMKRFGMLERRPR